MSLSVSVPHNWSRASGDGPVTSTAFSVAVGDVVVAVVQCATTSAPTISNSQSTGWDKTVSLLDAGSSVGLYMVGRRITTASGSYTISASTSFYEIGAPAIKVYKVTGGATSPMGQTWQDSSLTNNTPSSPSGGTSNPGAAIIAAGLFLGQASAITTGDEYTTAGTADYAGGYPSAGWRSNEGTYQLSFDGAGSGTGTWLLTAMEILPPATATQKIGWGLSSESRHPHHRLGFGRDRSHRPGWTDWTRRCHRPGWSRWSHRTRWSHWSRRDHRRDRTRWSHRASRRVRTCRRHWRDRTRRQRQHHDDPAVDRWHRLRPQRPRAAPGERAPVPMLVGR
jgi:hypothetical protein